jgi:ABC-type transport system involved in multi-copper enzyme maturation permease subunit
MRAGSPLWALVRVTWRELLSRPFVGIICLVFCAVEISLGSSMHDLNDPTLILTVILGAGSIGRDVSSGVLPLLFTRPIARRTYVFAKWIAVSSAASVVGAAALAIQALLLWRQGAGLSAPAIGAAVFGGATTAWGVASVLVFLSVLVAGVGDVGLWYGLHLVGILFARKAPARFNEEWRALIQPSLAWDALSGSHLLVWFRLVSYLSTVTFFLVLAVTAANRKELSYASG